MTKDRRQIFPSFSKGAVDRAAARISRALNNGEKIDKNDEEIVENWRASHAHIINTWQVILRKNMDRKKVGFGQRHKRKKTIYDKLKRYPDMSLSRMHDIAGCRLIFKNEADMMSYIQKIHSKNSFSHIRKEGQFKNYIENPKESGYRGIHDVYAYKSRNAKDRSKNWDGLLIEIQYRTIYQHAWATAVEVAGVLTGNRTKFSEGDEDQKEFFKYASEIIARAYEDRKSCKATLSNEELINEFNKLEEKTNLLTKLSQLKVFIKRIKKETKNIILKFSRNEHGTSLTIFSFQTSNEATKEYFSMEEKNPDDDIVLVKAVDDKNIRNAFKNYFGDTRDFVTYIVDGLEKLATPRSN